MWETSAHPAKRNVRLAHSGWAGCHQVTWMVRCQLAPYIEVSTSSPLTETATMKQAAWFRATSDLCSARISVPASFTPEWLLSDDVARIAEALDDVEPMKG